MGILDTLKQTAADTLKKTADATAKNAMASTSKAAEAAINKAAALVGSKVASAMSNTPTASPPNQAASSPFAAAAAKAASLVGSKVAQGQQSYAMTGELSSAEVEAIIEARVRQKGRPSNWKVSIVDLMTALDMNSSLESRKMLAARMNYPGYAPDGSAEKNMWLHAELLRALAQNGGEVPSYLLVGSQAAPAEQSYYANGSYATPNGLTPEVEAIIEARVRAKGKPSNWRVSIVDLMSALDMNSSLDARRDLAYKLNYSGSDADGSAEKNMWLHEELLRAIAENGGEVPFYLL